MSEQTKIKVGDQVRSKFYGIVGTVIGFEEGGYVIGPDHAEEMWIADDDAEAYDPKTAFLSELKELLEKYNAKIAVDFNQSDETYTTTIAFGEDSVKYSYTDGVDCDNIMDYDKE